MEWIGWTIRTVFAYVVNLTAWDVVGYVGQLFFLSRFIVQWIVTERKRKSTIPVAFWYLSLVGTIILLTYSIHLRNPIFILGFSLNMVIYLRNLYFIHLRPGQAR
ncbi:MAG: lipid-A-disaccharide synthase N-terminal domain-containing protein [Planctomycetes bacterium]|nr:lipid-A-disaccharide synthase N-terminal domain-containing protein [Planctomycetota bacterium]